MQQKHTQIWRLYDEQLNRSITKATKLQKITNTKAEHNNVLIFYTLNKVELSWARLNVPPNTL